MVAASGLKPKAVRIDSGDPVAISREVRRIFDERGWGDTAILLSGDLDEMRIVEILAAAAPVDGFGVGTAVSTSSDAPALSGVYKLAEIERGGRFVPVFKKSPGKSTYPGRKQVWRVMRDGVAVEDVLALEDVRPPADAEPLLRQVMKKGERLSRPSLAEIRDRCRQQVATLPSEVTQLIDGKKYPVQIRIVT
jgi:nicotinate phosphoribosyltransferase